VANPSRKRPGGGGGGRGHGVSREVITTVDGMLRRRKAHCVQGGRSMAGKERRNWVQVRRNLQRKEKRKGVIRGRRNERLQ